MGTKGIISASIVVFAVLISMVVLSGVASAGVSQDEGRSIGDPINGTGAIIGETNLSFVDADGVLIPKGRIEAAWEGEPFIFIPFDGYFNSHYYEDELVKGPYRVIGETRNTTIYFDRPKLDVEIRDEEGEREISKVLQGSNITFKAVTNLNTIDQSSSNISYKLVTPDDVSAWYEDIALANGTDVTKITVRLDPGEYKLSIKADSKTNNGLEAEGPSVSFTVEERSITIEADVKKQAANEDIIFDISTTDGFTNFSLNVTRGADTNVEFVELKFVGDTIDSESIGHSISEKTDEDGNYKAIARFTELGVYEITATDTDAPDANIKASETVEIEDFLATVSVEKTEFYTGEHVNINGSANAGESITVEVVDGEEIETDVSIEEEEFSCTWRTGGSQPGSYEIGIWVLPFSNPDKGDPPDASVTVLLMQGGLSATLNTKVVALGDEFEIEGFASGRERVDILTIGPKGGSGDGLSPASSIASALGLMYSICSVLPEGDFKDEIRVDENADTGTYSIAVLSYGRDGVWGTSGSNNLTGVLSSYPGSLAVKTQEQILAILKDRTINAAGSDDLLSINTIKVENPKVRLDDIEDVMIGGSIVVSGYTNRKEDFGFIITVEGPVELKPKLAFVEKDGTFNVSFSTVSARTGEYTVTADDGKGYSDTKTVNVITATTPLLSVENSIGNSSVHSPATGASSQSQDVVNEDAASADSTPLSRIQAEAKKQAGFEAIFAVIGLAAVVVWLGLKRRRRG